MMAGERARFIFMEMFEYIVPYLGESTVRDAEALHLLSIAIGRNAPYHNTDVFFDLAQFNAGTERMKMFKADKISERLRTHARVCAARGDASYDCDEVSIDELLQALYWPYNEAVARREKT